MDTFEKIMEILSNDEKAQTLMTKLNHFANAGKFTNEQYQKGKEMVFLMAIQSNLEAFKTLSDSVWEKLN